MKRLPYVKLVIKDTSIPALGMAGAIKTLGKHINLYSAQMSIEVRFIVLHITQGQQWTAKHSDAIFEY